MKTMKTIGFVAAMVFAAACGKSTDTTKPAETKPGMKPGASMATSAPSMAMASSAPAMMAPGSSMAGSMAAGAGIPDADFKMGLGFLNSLVDTANKDKGNCDAMADDLGKVMDSSKDAIAKIQTMKASKMKGTPEQEKQLQDTMMKFMPALAPCATNAKMKAFGDRMKSTM